MFNSVAFWIFLGILLILSEFVIPGFTIFFFGIGALITALIIFIFPNIENLTWLQGIIFLTTSITLFITLRNKFSKTLKGEMFHEKTDYIGMECIVVEQVSHVKPGRISYQGTTWNAFSNDGVIKKSSKALILEKKDGDPMTFIIKKIRR